MRLVLDTNVMISGVYFSGPPYDILDAWRRGRIRFVVSVEILDEYRRVGEQLAKQFPGVQVEAFLELLTLRARIVNAPSLKEKVCSDQMMTSFLLVRSRVEQELSAVETKLCSKPPVIKASPSLIQRILSLDI